MNEINHDQFQLDPRITPENAIRGISLNPGQWEGYKLLANPALERILFYGGARSGKTMLHCSTIIDRAFLAPGSRHLITRRTLRSARAYIANDTMPKTWLMKFGVNGQPMPRYDGDMHRHMLPNGSEIWYGGMNDKNASDRVLGGEYATIFQGEANEFIYDNHEQLLTRLAQKVLKDPSCCDGREEYLRWLFLLDLNPDSIRGWIYRLFFENVNPYTGDPIDNSKFGVQQINPIDNIKHLGKPFLKRLEGFSARKRLRMLDGKFLADVDGALWRRENIKHAVIKIDPKTGDEIMPTKFKRVVVAIDPSISNKIGSDETGMVVVGLGEDGLGYVLEDATEKFKDTTAWVRRAHELYVLWDADEMVAEVNQGGDIVEMAIMAEVPAGRKKPRYTAVHATKGKYTRAEPVAALYGNGRIMHLRNFPKLEGQMCEMTSDFDRNAAGYSPDALDAMVWGFTCLFPRLIKRNVVKPTKWETPHVFI